MYKKNIIHYNLATQILSLFYLQEFTHYQAAVKMKYVNGKKHGNIGKIKIFHKKMICANISFRDIVKPKVSRIISDLGYRMMIMKMYQKIDKIPGAKFLSFLFFCVILNSTYIKLVN